MLLLPRQSHFEKLGFVLKLYSMLKDLSLEGNRYVRTLVITNDDGCPISQDMVECRLRGAIRGLISIHNALMANGLAMISLCLYLFSQLPV